jgi:hypothetical protein
MGIDSTYSCTPYLFQDVFERVRNYKNRSARIDKATASLYLSTSHLCLRFLPLAIIIEQTENGKNRVVFVVRMEVEMVLWAHFHSFQVRE